MHRCTGKIKRKKQLDARDRELVCVNASVTASLFICVCAALRLHVTSVSWMCLQANDSCGQRCRWCWWLLETALALQTRGGGGRHCAPFYVHAFQNVLVKCVQRRPCAFLPSRTCRRWVWQVPLSTHGGPLQTRWMVSASVRGATAGRPRPLLATALDPVLWQLLTAPDGWQDHPLPSPTHKLASWKLQVWWGINVMSHSAL